MTTFKILQLLVDFVPRPIMGLRTWTPLGVQGRNLSPDPAWFCPTIPNLLPPPLIHMLCCMVVCYIYVLFWWYVMHVFYVFSLYLFYGLFPKINTLID